MSMISKLDQLKTKEIELQNQIVASATLALLEVIDARYSGAISIDVDEEHRSIAERLVFADGRTEDAPDDDDDLHYAIGNLALPLMTHSRSRAVYTIDVAGVRSSVAG